MPRTKDAALEKARKLEILAAASRCFIRHGLHQASMRQICAEAGLSAGAVYNYFPSKENIIEGLADLDRSEIGELADYIASQKNTYKAVVQSARWVMEETSQEDMQLQVDMAAEAGRNERIHTLIKRNDDALFACFHEAIVRGQAAGQISKAQKPEAMAEAVLAVCEGFMGRLLFADKKERKRLAKLTEATVAALLKP